MKSVKCLGVLLALASAACGEPPAPESEAQGEQIAVAECALIVYNGRSLNGWTQNGSSQNGSSQNGFAQNGAHLNGTNLNGTSLNGLSMNRIILNGRSLNGRSVNGRSANGAALNQTTLSGELAPAPSDENIQLDQGWLVTDTLAPDALIGAELVADGTIVRIDAVAEEGGLPAYTLSQMNDAGEFEPLCPGGSPARLTAVD